MLKDMPTNIDLAEFLKSRESDLTAEHKHYFKCHHKTKSGLHIIN